MRKRFEDSENADFAAILAAFESEQAAPRSTAPKIGDKLRCQIVNLGEDTAFVDLGGKSEGMIPLEELRDEEGQLTVAIGDTVEAAVVSTESETGNLVLRVRATRSGRTDLDAALIELRQAYENRLPVEGRVSGVNKGGVEVEIAGMRGFCPISQLELGYVADASEYVGRRLSFRISRLEQGHGQRPNVVLSRRDLLAEEAAARSAEALARLEVGKVIRGTVTSLASYGAFVDLGGVEGLLHVSEISHGRVSDPAEVLTVGQSVEVAVLRIEPAKPGARAGRISLSMRSLEPDPWSRAADRFPEGMVLGGRVMRLEPFGAFVQIAPGLEGLVHVSELGGGRRIDHPRQALQLGQDLPVKVLGVDATKRRISLAPAEVDAEAEEGGEEALTPAASDTGSFGTLADAFKKVKSQRAR